MSGSVKMDRSFQRLRQLSQTGRPEALDMAFRSRAGSHDSVLLLRCILFYIFATQARPSCKFFSRFQTFLWGCVLMRELRATMHGLVAYNVL